MNSFLKLSCPLHHSSGRSCSTFRNALQSFYHIPFSLKIRLLFISFLLFSVCLSPHRAESGSPDSGHNSGEYSKVIAVLDGDTIEIEGGRRVRYIGIDAPDREHPLYLEAKNKNEELVLNKTVKLEICAAESRDIYGRILAFVYADDTMVNAELLKLGYAQILIIPPCGTKKEPEFRQYQHEAMQKKLGIWKKKAKVHLSEDSISASDASKFINERKAVHGNVLNIRRSEKALFMDLGDGEKVHIKLVIFSEDERNFSDLGIDIEKEYSGKRVVVYGKIKLYKDFPEIIIRSPSQIEVIK